MRNKGMTRKVMLAVILASLASPLTRAAEEVTVGGIAFPTRVDQSIGDKLEKLVLTGAGVREKYLFGVYAVASYAREGAKVKNAQELAAADYPKGLHLVMLRAVSGKDLADAFTEAIRLNYPAPALKDEIEQLTLMMRKKNTQRGDHIWLRHVPGVGLECDFAGELFLIGNVDLARAVWQIYFGPKNIGEKLKRNLTSQL